MQSKSATYVNWRNRILITSDKVEGQSSSNIRFDTISSKSTFQPLHCEKKRNGGGGGGFNWLIWPQHLIYELQAWRRDSDS